MLISRLVPLLLPSTMLLMMSTSAYPTELKRAVKMIQITFDNSPAQLSHPAVFTKGASDDADSAGPFDGFEPSPEALRLFFEEATQVGELFRNIALGRTPIHLPDGHTIEHVKEAYNRALVMVEKFKVEHPTEYDFIKDAVLIAAVTVVAPELLLVVLRAVGFGSSGIIFRSIASGIQAAKGDIDAGSLFAWLTSLAMRGRALPQLRNGLSFMYAVSGLATYVFHWLKAKLGYALLDAAEECYGYACK